MAEVTKQLQKYVFKKGNKLGGRKKGKTLKEYARDYLAKMTEEERVEYLNGLDRDLIWRMSEGNPATKTTLDGELKLPKPIMDVKDGVQKDNSIKKHNILAEED